jgi:glycosyltransferase involved in cell wall biosynthesis
MRILFLLPEFPYPPSSGGRIKIFNELLFLSELHQCDILCFGTVIKKQRQAFLKALPKVNILETISQNSGIIKSLMIVKNIFFGLPPSFSTFTSRRFCEALKKYIAKADYDVIHYDIINMAQYLKFASHIPSMHSPNDATSFVYFRMLKNIPWSVTKIFMLISAIYLRRFEKCNYHLFSNVHVVSDADSEYLKNLNSQIKIDILPTILNSNQLVKLSSHERLLNNKSKNINIVCTGNLGNPSIAKGVESFLMHALPLLLKKAPSTKFFILGQNIKPGLYKKMNKIKNIKFYSSVNNYRSFLSRADIVLMADNLGPAGPKTRTLESMALGLTVVGTASAFDGIPFVNGKHGFIYQNMEHCVELILMLIFDKSKRDAIGDMAHKLIEKNFSLDILGPQYEKLYLDAIDQHKKTYDFRC